jgi:glycosyltransferase 2 family protein
VQAIQTGTVYCILLALGVSIHLQEWIFIFLVASVISVLPISLGGGLGTREFVFVEGSRFFHLDPQLGLVISLLFYLTSLVAHAGGLYYIFHDPLKKEF